MSSPRRTTIHLLRHGEVFNPDGIIYGRLPGFVLSELGHHMAQRVAEHLRDHEIATIIASPMERAQQTAEPLASVHDLPIEIDERVIEAANSFEGESFSASALINPRVLGRLTNPFKPSWGEPYDEIAARMSAAMDSAREAISAMDAPDGSEAVIVSHQLPIWIARQYHQGKRLWHDPRSRECSLASLTSFTYAGDVLESIGYAEPAGDLLAGASKVVGA